MGQIATAPKPGNAWGIASIVLGLSSWLMPYFAAAIIAPAGLACAIIAMANRQKFYGLLGLIAAGISMGITFMQFWSLSR